MLERKVYTRSGDDGTTTLFSGKRVPKHDIRIKAYGTIDELNSWMGIIRDSVKNSPQDIIRIQKNLMTIGSQLANDKEDFPIEKIKIDDVALLEQNIDTMTADLPPLRNFVIPGGHAAISYTHLTRSVCRRAERYITELNENVKVEEEIIVFINRLSDYLFTLSRKLTHDFEVEEVKWEPTRK